jgi:hypothetical protein
MMSSQSLCLSGLALVLMYTGCGGETNRAVFKRYESQFAAKRQQFQSIAGSLPAPGSVRESNAASLSPKPVYDTRSSRNTEIVMYDQLLNPDIKSEGHNRLDLLLAGDLLRAMQWTGPANPMSPSVLDKKADDIEQILKQALAMRYLVVVRPARFVAPVAVDENNYKGGAADVEVFVADLETNKVPASGGFTAQSAKNVEYMFKKGDDKQSRLAEFAYSSMFTDARQKLGSLLQQITGGQFALEK